MAPRLPDWGRGVSNGDAVVLKRWDYAPKSGKAFVLREIRKSGASLDAVAKLERAMKRLEDGVDTPQETDLVRDGVYELRVQADKRWYRLLWGRSGKRLVAISFFVKKSNKIPKDAIDLAVTRLSEFPK